MGLKLIFWHDKQDNEFHRRIIEGVKLNSACRSSKCCHHFLNPVGSGSLAGAARLTSGISACAAGITTCVFCSSICAKAASGRRTCRWWHEERDYPGHTYFGQSDADDDSREFPLAGIRRL